MAEETEGEAEKQYDLFKKQYNLGYGYDKEDMRSFAATIGRIPQILSSLGPIITKGAEPYWQRLAKRVEQMVNKITYWQ